MKNVLINVDTLERFKFFRRMVISFNQLDYFVIFLTNKLSVYLLARKNKFKVFLIDKNTNIKNNETIVKKTDLRKNALEIMAGYLNFEEATNIFILAYNLVNNIYNKVPVDIVLIWNGSKVIDLAINEFCKEHKIKTVFMEIGNIPGKLFADPIGVNAKSALFENVAVLDHYTIVEQEYDKWKKTYLNIKLEKHIVPQTKIIKKINRGFIIDYIGFNILNIPRDNNIGFIEKVIEKMHKKNKFVFYDNVFQSNITKNGYVFFPMQVSDDSQILLNSGTGNVEAIKYAYEIAKKNKVKLLVKPHPAEKNMKHINDIFELKRKLGFYLVDGNTFEFIRDAQSVIVINSTTGLEAKIMDKDVTFLGRSFYSLLSRKYLQKYILGYLIDIDYFGEEPISIIQIENLIKRAGLHWKKR